MFPKQLSAGAAIVAALTLPMACAHAAKSPTALYIQAVTDDANSLAANGELELAQASPSSYTGKHFDIEGRVAGFVSTDTGKTALVTLSGSSVAVQVPPAMCSEDCLNNGENTRLLISVHPSKNNGSCFSLVMATPAGPVDAVDAARRAQEQSRSEALAERAAELRLGGSTSRSWNSRASRADYQSTNVEGMPLGSPITSLPPSLLRVYPQYRSAIHGLNKSLSNSDLDKITTSVLYYSNLKRLDPRLVIAMIIAESNFNLRSTSHTGAMGLGQLMPQTASGLGISNPYDPVQNIGAAVHILRGHLDEYGGAMNVGDIVPDGQIALIMSAYNAGPGAVRKYHGVPPFLETQRYVAKVTALYHKLCGANS